MSYNVHNFVDGDTIFAAPINEMDQQIQTNETKINEKIPNTEKGAANGVATLDENGDVPPSQLPDARILPAVTEQDEGKFLRVSEDGEWVAETIPDAAGNEF